MKKPVAVVCVSGGMDSCVTAAIAAQSHEIALLHVNYGQRTEARELKSFAGIADFYKVTKRLIVDLRHLSAVGGSALTDRAIDVPTRDTLEGTVPNSGTVPITYVPFRNANILAAAVAWAETLGARAVYIGAVEEDSSGYPDCRESFFDAYRKAVTLGTRPESGIEIVTPVIHLRKAEIVKKGSELGAPLHLTWSCYQSEREACGRCDSCLLRLRAFKEAGVKDAIPYKPRI